MRVNQISSRHSANGYENYSYYPVIRYEYNGQVYETEYDSRNGLFSSELWNEIEVNCHLDVFINPADENEIYVPLPDALNEKKNANNNKIKKFLIAFLLFGFWLQFLAYFLVNNYLGLLSRFGAILAAFDSL